jgi:hypothetical protein
MRNHSPSLSTAEGEILLVAANPLLWVRRGSIHTSPCAGKHAASTAPRDAESTRAYVDKQRESMPLPLPELILGVAAVLKLRFESRSTGAIPTPSSIPGLRQALLLRVNGGVPPPPPPPGRARNMHVAPYSWRRAGPGRRAEKAVADAVGGGAYFCDEMMAVVSGEG